MKEVRWIHITDQRGKCTGECRKGNVGGMFRGNIRE